MTPLPHDHVDEVVELFDRGLNAHVAAYTPLIEARARELAREEVGRFARILLDRLAPEPSVQALNFRIVSRALEVYEEREQ